MSSSSKVIKIKKSVFKAQPVSDKLLNYMQDDELKSLIDEKVERVRQKAYQEGYQKGIQEGSGAKQQEFAKATQLVDAVVNDFNAFMDTLHNEFDHEIVQLVVGMAQTVIKKELSRPDIVSNVIIDALEKCRQKRNIVIHLHPESGHHFEQIVAQMKQRNFDLSQIQIEIDPSVAEGGCFIETDSEAVDARIDHIFSEVRHKIEELVTWEPTAQPHQ